MNEEVDLLIAHSEALLQRAEWMSISAYARKYGITRHTVYKWIAEGWVEHYRVPSLVRIKDSPPRKCA